MKGLPRARPMSPLRSPASLAAADPQPAQPWFSPVDSPVTTRDNVEVDAAAAPVRLGIQPWELEVCHGY